MLKIPLVRSGASEVPAGLINAVDVLADHSIPVYVYKKDATLEQIGTAFVLCRNNRRFLVTAGHCVKTLLAFNRDAKYSGAVVLAFGEKTYAIEQSMHFMITNEDSNDLASTLDIGALEISAGFTFSQHAMSSEICASRAFSHALPSSRVSVLGYSNKLNKKPIRTTPNAESMVDGGIQAHITYPLQPSFDLTKIGLHESRHAAITWPKKDSNGNTVGVPRGLSGSPVWCMPHSPNTIENPKDAIVVGVFIEYHKSHNIAVYTKASQVIRFIDNTFFNTNS